MSLLGKKSKDKKRDKEIREKLELDRKTFEDIKTSFLLMDRDNSGSISHAEFKEMMARHKCRSTDREIHEMLLNADKDNSGAIEFEEFATMLATKFKENAALDKEIKVIFDKYDTNGDGFLGRREIQRMFLDMENRPLSDAEADDIIRTYDKDDDGALCLSEFTQYIYDNQ